MLRDVRGECYDGDYEKTTAYNKPLKATGLT